MDLGRLRNKPVLVRPLSGPLTVGLPYGSDNRQWLREIIGTRRPRWVAAHKTWADVPRNKWAELREAMVARYGLCHLVVQRKAGADRCTVKCLEARGDDCSCVCAGEFHGTESSYAYDWKAWGDHGMIRAGATFWWTAELRA